jgi:hypothetical protein
MAAITYVAEHVPDDRRGERRAQDCRERTPRGRNADASGATLIASAAAETVGVQGTLKWQALPHN